MWRYKFYVSVCGLCLDLFSVAVCVGNSGVYYTCIYIVRILYICFLVLFAFV